ncbi:MAG: multidrug effflux MFS transporter [Rhizobiaceae bacterium]
MNRPERTQGDTLLPSSTHAPLSLATFVAFAAALMSLNALATDIMLPGFPEIAASFGQTDVTSVQAIVTAYLLGFGLSQFFTGFITDRYGRRPILIAGLLIYSVAAVFTAVATSLSMMLVWRFIQGVGAAAPRVITSAAIRDCYQGRRMAAVMSLVMTVFMVAPIIAPAIGQGILIFAHWRWIFTVLAAYGIVLLIACAFVFPETLAVERRREISPARIAEAVRSVLGSRQTMGYSVSAGVFFGALFGYIASSQQVLVGIYELGIWFPLVFALLALTISTSSFVNARIVERFGMRLLSHMAVIAYSVLSFTMAMVAVQGWLSLPVFLVLMSMIMMIVGLVFSNFNALAMEPQGHVAGVAASFIGGITVIVGASIGYYIGLHFDGTVVPMALGFGFCGIASMLIVVWTERGKLFGKSNG